MHCSTLCKCCTRALCHVGAGACWLSMLWRRTFPNLPPSTYLLLQGAAPVAAARGAHVCRSHAAYDGGHPCLEHAAGAGLHGEVRG